MTIKLISIFLFFSSTLCAQVQMDADTSAVKSIDGILHEMLRLLSGEEGKKRNFEALRNLFLPTANFTVHSHADSSSQPVETVSLDEFVTLLQDPYYEEGFTEYEISKEVDEYNGIAQVFQTFHAKDSEDFEETGITSYQLVYFQNRWWIVNVLWTGESNGIKVPQKYLD